ncbi:MAG: T9SS type A sorting domain-containing protein [Chlorobi bacterium]|nr:T9SS type A sorting domain-containing protein [Chlorobiota bacterium]
MKNKIIIIIIFVVNIIYSQQEPISEAIKYYPLHIGDYWEYQVTMSGQAPSENDNWIGYKSIIGDSILSNNNKYFVVKSNRLGTQNNDFIYTQFIRIDSTNGNVYQYDYDNNEILLDSLFIEPNDTVVYSCKMFSSIYSKDVFGENVKTRFYQYACVTWENLHYDYELSQGFGEIHKNYSYAPVTQIFFEYNLVYTKINGIEYGIKTDVVNASFNQIEFNLEQNYPNPFNPVTTIKYSIPFIKKGLKLFVQLSIYNVLGQKVATLVNRNNNPGNYQVNFSADNLPSGVYIYRLAAGNFVQSRKMILLK